MAVVCAVDVGTRSARAGLFDRSGKLLGRGEHPIAINQPRPNHAEHSSQDIWDAVCQAVRQARELAGVDPADVVGIGFDSTCSLVVLDRDGKPLPVSATGSGPWDTLVWLDHRAHAEAAECTATGHRVLGLVGGAMSPEMQTPKAMWLKRHLPEIWPRIGYLFDLPDYLTWRACGCNARSQCALVSKWPYLAHEDSAWQNDFLASVDLSDLREKGRLPDRATPVGATLGKLTAQSSDQLGLTSDCRVATGLVDAFAGALGVFGATGAGGSPGREVALIAGTSSCVMTYLPEPRSFAGFWGPYFEVTLPGVWMSEGGQSATGALLDHVLRTHAAGGEPTAALHGKVATRVAALREQEGAAFAQRLHVLPDFHGNRTPMADPTALGVISGLTLDSSFDGLCRLYWRTCVAIALGLRHILESMREQGSGVETLHVTGGHTKSPLLIELYADVTGCRLMIAEPDEAMLLGTAMVAAAGAGLFPDLASAAAAMRRQKAARLPNASVTGRYERDYRVFLEMHRQRRLLDAMN